MAAVANPIAIHCIRRILGETRCDTDDTAMLPPHYCCLVSLVVDCSWTDPRTVRTCWQGATAGSDRLLIPIQTMRMILGFDGDSQGYEFDRWQLRRTGLAIRGT
jgi:hypothetical protein